MIDSVRRVALVICIVVSTTTVAGELSVSAFEFESPELAERYNALIQEFRCPKCLNTSLAGSDAPIAKDLRRAVHRLLHDGKTDQEIRDYMLARYGDFILYKPRMTPATLLLWFSPLILVLLLALALLRVRSRKSAVELSDDERRRVQELTTE